MRIHSPDFPDLEPIIGLNSSFGTVLTKYLICSKTVVFHIKDVSRKKNHGTTRGTKQKPEPVKAVDITILWNSQVRKATWNLGFGAGSRGNFCKFVRTVKNFSNTVIPNSTGTGNTVWFLFYFSLEV